MLVLIFEDDEEAKKAIDSKWTYASWISQNTYKEVTDALDKFQ